MGCGASAQPVAEPQTPHQILVAPAGTPAADAAPVSTNGDNDELVIEDLTQETEKLNRTIKNYEEVTLELLLTDCLISSTLV